MTRLQKIILLAESAMMVALGTVLSLIKVYEAPFGGSVTLLSMAPIIILSLRRGVKVGLPAAFVYSVMQLILGIGNVAWVPSAGGRILCILFDYILAFTVLGLAGFAVKIPFSSNDKTNLWIGAVIGTLVVVLLRFACHIVSGAVIWYALDLEWYADDPGHIVHQYGAWLFSVVYNGGFMVPEIIETMVGVPVLTRALAKFRV
ncbi:MAG: energy-coupled thiamine transporter ThiT [Clostridia bacterium]|nr:energy-coupled thiamine transporter ThiT [Clostridia bacterium]